MSSQLEQTSAILGKYLLLGWTMGDACDKPNCVGCPLMSKGSDSFCARCDGPPDRDSSRPSLNPAVQASTPSVISPRSSIHSIHSLSSTVSDLSTPASELHEIPLANPLPVIPVDPETEARWRQSDLASAQIGSRLLKGWILLAQECVNPTCHGIPLMKRPKPRPAYGEQEQESSEGSKKQRKFAASGGSANAAILADPRKFCVICEQNYVDERDQGALAAWTEANKPIRPIPTAAQAGPSESSKGKKRAIEDVIPPVVKQEVTSKTRISPQDEQSSKAVAPSETALAALQKVSSRLVDHLNALSASSILNVQEISKTSEALTNVHKAMKEVQ